MRDMFDEFMEELRRRQAEQRRQQGQPDGEQTPPDGETEPPSEEDTTARAENGQGGGDDEEEPVRRPATGPRRGPGGPFDGGFGFPPRGPRAVGPEAAFPFHFGRGTVIAVLAVIAVLILIGFFGAGINLWTDAIWYDSVGFAGVFWTRLWSQLGLFLAGAIVAFLLMWLNIWLAGRLVPPGPRRRISLDDLFDRFDFERDSNGVRYRSRRSPGGGGEIELPSLSRALGIGLMVVAAILALSLGGLLGGHWETVQLWLHRVSFGTNDPVFGIDAGFYLFQLPFLRLVQSYANTLLLVAFAMAGLRYLLAVLSGSPMPTMARLHLGVLLGLYLISIAAGLQLDKLELLYGNNGVATGVSYTDANARFLALNILTVLAAFAGAFLVLFAYARWLLPLWLTIGLWIVANGVLTFGYPALVQRFVVDPNQQNQEAPYIANNIAMTRLGFGLNAWTSSQYTPQTAVNAAQLAAEPATLQNARLWDYRPLAQTLDGLQVIRQYYNFNDIDTDRYTFNDATSCAPAAAPCVRQVWLAGRELDYTKLDQSWVNQHVTYTHGIGVAMVPVNEVVSNESGSGQPKLVIQNLPPSSNSGAPKISRPQIYFGTQPTNWVVVAGSSPEFDYPAPSTTGPDTYTSWTGKTGVKLDNALSRLLFAMRFGDLNLFISNQVTGSSQLLFHQSIQERVSLIAPFLRFDKDPYLVVTADGRLVYMLDAYTTSAAFPNAQSFDPGGDPSVSGLAGSPFNYIRNSVKIVMDAYDGSMTFYVADPNDAIVKAYQGVFPSLFRPIADMPADLKAHIRYPEDLFNAQTSMYERYHVTDPGVFYQGNDLWQAPQSQGTGTGGGGNAPQQLPLEAYYVVMRVPQAAAAGAQITATNPEFLLLQPMVPRSRPNMIAWVAARNDLPQYGQVVAFDFPRDSSIFGPQQMQGLFAQNRDISQQITLWSQQGSQVILGNLLVVPLQNSILYIEPVYIQATQNPLPVFQKVIVATPSQIVWGDTLQDAITQILAGRGSPPGPSPSPGTSPTPGPSPSVTPSAPPSTTPVPGVSLPPNATAQQIIAEANRHYLLAQQALRNQDLATYQREINLVGQLLDQLQRVVGTPAP